MILDSMLHDSPIAWVAVSMMAIVAYGVAVAFGACRRQVHRVRHGR